MTENGVGGRSASGTGWLRAAVSAAPEYRSPGTFANFVGPDAGQVHLLHLNESPFPPSPAAVAAAEAEASNLNRYPDPMATALASELAARTGVPANRIVFGCGSEELIQGLVGMTIEPGDEAVVPAPSFPLFAAAVAQRNGVAMRANVDSHGANDPQTLLSKVTARTRLIFCCTPNPPSGAMMSRAALEELVAGVPANVVLVLDEAYLEYARHSGGPDGLACLRGRTGPWVSLRTFSKAYGLAGARIGYALCGSDEVAGAMRKVRLSYGASSVAQAAALAALKDEAYLRDCLDRLELERTRLIGKLNGLGLPVYPTVTNFVSVTLPMESAGAMHWLRARGILVRDWRDPDYLKELRITVGLREGNDAIVSALETLLEEHRRATPGYQSASL